MLVGSVQNMWTGRRVTEWMGLLRLILSGICISSGSNLVLPLWYYIIYGFALSLNPTDDPR